MAIEIENPFLPWQQAALRPNFNIIYETQAGMLVARVMRGGYPEGVSQFEFDRVGSLDGWNGVAPAPAGTRFALQILFTDDVPPRRILFHLRRDELWQVFVGISHPDTRVFLNLPQNVRTHGINNEIGNPVETMDDEFGWFFEGNDSDHDNPTNAAEFFLPQQFDVELGVINTSNFGQHPMLKLILNQLVIRGFDARNQADRDVIKGILRGTIPSKLVGRAKVPFPITNQQFNQNWSVPPIAFDGVSFAYKDPTSGQETAF